MSTNTKNLNIAFDLLLAEARFYPRSKIINELNIIADRIKFSGKLQELFASRSVNKEKVKIAINTLFKDDISEEIFGFLLALAENDLSELFTVDNSLELIDYCQNQLYKIKELFFISPIPLSISFREKMITKIKSVFVDEEIRVIFIVKPSVVIGFILQDEKVLYDYSFKTNFVYYLNSYFKKKLETIK